MIITNQFVYIHMSKTGGTFVSKILRQIHEKRGDEIIECRAEDRPRRRWWQVGKTRRPQFLMLTNKQYSGEYDQHGTVSQIPEEYAHLPVLTTIRNPYDRYVSHYEFKWWVHRPLAFTKNPEKITAMYPDYPELTFEQFIRVFNTYFDNPPPSPLPPDLRLGRQSAHFIRYYYTQPERIAVVDDAYLASGQHWKDLHPRLHFTFTESLNQQLHDYLLGAGYDPAEIAFIIPHEKILPKEGGRSEDQAWQKYYTPELKQHVRHIERMLFMMFPQWDV